MVRRRLVSASLRDSAQAFQDEHCVGRCAPAAPPWAVLTDAPHVSGQTSGERVPRAGDVAPGPVSDGSVAAGS